MKKIIALTLAVLMVIGMFAGCDGTTGGGGGGGSSSADYEVDENGQFIYGDTFEGTTVEWWFSSHYGLNEDMYMFKKLEEVIGCDIKVVRYDSETYAVKLNAALQSNDLPDMCAMVVSHSLYNTYGEQGAFVNLLSDDSLSKMPNLKSYILDNPQAADLLESYKSSSGALYGLPSYNVERTVNFGWMYREDIFEKHGIEMWHDSESFLEVLRELKRLYPDTYPMTGASMEVIFNRVINGYGHNSTYTAYDWTNNKWYLGAATEGYYEMMSLFQTIWNEDLMDPDIFTNNVNDIDTAILQETSFVYNSWIGRMATENPAGQELNPDFQVSYAPHIGDGKADQLPLVGMTGTVINAQSDALTVDACLAIWNYLYSEEGGKVFSMGEEGKTYKVENGEKVYLNADGSVMKNPTIQTLEEQHGLWNGSMIANVSRDSVYFTFSPEEAEAQEIGAQGGFLMRTPTPIIDEEYAEDYYDLADKLNREVKQYNAKFVTENYSRAQWEEQVAKWNKDYADLFAILNGTY